MTTSATTTQQPGRIGFVKTWLQLRTRLSGRFWLAFAIVMSLVLLFRLPWILPNGFEKHMPVGELSHFRFPRPKTFLWIHLASILPSGALAVTQFVPRIRARAMNFHRNAGKVINVLTFISTLSAWGIAYVSFGGDMSIQGGSYVLGIMTLWSTVKSWTAIRRLQIDEHRTWVLRSWSYQMSVITLRVLAVSLAIIISIVGGFYHSMPCKEVEFILNDKDLYAREYPQCQADWNGSPVTHVAVLADVTENDDLRRTAAVRAVFGLSTWAGLWIHAVVCEYYLFLTKDESDRLKMVSEKRRKARQMLNERQSASQ